MSSQRCGASSEKPIIKCTAVGSTTHRRCKRDAKPNMECCWQHEHLDPKCALSFRQPTVAPVEDSIPSPSILATAKVAPSSERKIKCTAIGSTTHRRCKRDAKPNMELCWQHDPSDPKCAPSFRQPAAAPVVDSKPSPSIFATAKVAPSREHKIKCTAIGSSTHRPCKRDAKPNKEHCWQHDPSDPGCAPSFRQPAVVPDGDGTSVSPSRPVKCLPYSPSRNAHSPTTSLNPQTFTPFYNCDKLTQQRKTYRTEHDEASKSTQLQELARGSSRQHDGLAPDRDPIEFSDYIPHYLHLATQAALRAKMKERLPKNKKPGFMYALEIQGPRYQDSERVLLKVGRSESFNTRLKDLRKQCPSKEYTPRGCWPCSIRSTVGEGSPWPLIVRVEQLVHLELKDLVVNAQHLDPHFDPHFLCMKRPSALIKVKSPTGQSRLGRNVCEDCGQKHREIFPLARILHGENEGKEWEHVVEPMIKRWGDFVRTLVDTL